MNGSDPDFRGWHLTDDVRVGRDGDTLSELLEDPGVGTVERRLGYDCLSGDHVDATWRGVPVGDLLDAVDPPGETTHVVVESTDGYRGCVGVGVAVEGMIALERDGHTLDGARFLAPGVEGPRAVKQVVSLDPVSLDPGEDRAEYETVGYDPEDEG
jgi:hypothetical protein